MSEGRTTTLGPFPLEIWILVCETLADRISQNPELHYTERGPVSDLKALCRVSKGISAEAERALFRSYDIRTTYTGWGVRTSHNGYSGRQGFPRLLRFVRTVLERPHLLSHVREATLKGPFSEDWPWPALLFDTYGRLAKRLGFDPTAFPLYGPYKPWAIEGVDTVSRLISWPAPFYNDADGTRRETMGPDLLMFLVISLLPRLKSLVFTGTLLPRVLRWLGMLGRMAKAGVFKPFDHIVDLRLGWDSLTDLYPLVPLLALTPNVKKLALWRCYGIRPDERLIEQARAPSFPRNIKTLEMHACIFGEAFIRFLLRSCPNLERFVFHAGGLPTPVRFFPTPPVVDHEWLLTARKILEALQDAKATLKEIDVDLTRGCPYRERGGPLTPADFDDFPVLERARVAHVGEAAHDDEMSTILSIGDNAAQLGVGACSKECSTSYSFLRPDD